MHSSLSPEKPSVFSQELTDVTVTEGEDLTLVCETAALDNPVCWTKDGKALRPSARCRQTYEGRRAQLVITDTTLQDSGRYKCETGGAWSSSIVRVHGEPLGGSWAASNHSLAPPELCPTLSVSISALFMCVMCVCGGGGFVLRLPLNHLCLFSSTSISLCSLTPISGSLCSS